jgi:integral membrane protein (TIGR01906 family)
LGVIRGLATLLFIIAIPIALVGTNVRYLANEDRVYEYAFDEYEASARTGIARAELVRASGELQDYFNNDVDLFFTRVEISGKETPLFNEREISHLKDVKHLFGWVFAAHEIAFVYMLSYVVAVFIWAREKSLRALAVQSLIGSLLTIGFIVFLAVFAISGFERAFERFHLIAFTNDLWRLDPRTDRLIQMFPEEFWFDVTILTGLLTVAEAAVLSVIAGVHLGVSRGAEESSYVASSGRA